jgi:hypothetical protein
MPDGIFQPQAPNLLGLAGTIEQIRGGRERRGLQREALNLQRQQQQRKQRQEQEQAIAEQRQRQFDQAATLLKNAPTPEIAVRSARIMGDTLGLEINEEKLIENLKSVQQGIGNILKLSAAGKKEDALNLSTAILQQFSGTKGAERIPGLQSGLMKDISGMKERERRGRGLFTTDVTPPLLEEGIEITPREETITGLTPFAQQVTKQRGPGALEAFAEAGFEGLKALPVGKTNIMEVPLGGGKFQVRGIDTETGNVNFVVSPEFIKKKAGKPTPPKAPKAGQVEFFKIGSDPSTGKPTLQGSKFVKTKDGIISPTQLNSLERQGFFSKSAASIKMRLENPNQLDTLLSGLLGGATSAQQPVPQAPKGALTFDQFLKREQARDPSVKRVDALEEYIKQIEAAR